MGRHAHSPLQGPVPAADQSAVSGLGLGEAFELAAWDADDEARPGRAGFGSRRLRSQPARAAASTRSGAAGTAVRLPLRTRVPLLPKILDIKELLSVQGHPAGHTEVYVIIDAEPGASIRLGFCRDIQPRALQAELADGWRQQQALWAVFSQGADPAALQGLLGQWLAQRHAPLSALPTGTLGTAGQWRAAADLLVESQGVVLAGARLDERDSGHARPGHPQRESAPHGRAGRSPPSAEVHALGNPEQKEILALEIPPPGPTFRAWDNVRFPIRAVDVTAAIASLNLRRTRPQRFSRQSRRGRRAAGHIVLRGLRRLPGGAPEATAGRPVAVGREPPHCLHAIRGRARFSIAAGAVVGDLARGESALVPIGVGGYRAASVAPDTEVIKVSLPCDAGRLV